MNPYDAFAARMRDLLGGDRSARLPQLAQQYWTEEYTGRWFHELADTDRPNEITARDIVAVSTLSVEIPARVSIWLLSDEGRTTVSELLMQVPVDADPWSAPEQLDEDGPLWRLWRVLDTACWPAPRAGNGMASTKISKLLATKRPTLVPIWDSVLRTLFPAVPNYWEAFRHALDDKEYRFQLAILTKPTGVKTEPAFLRRLDAVLWMIGQQPDW